MAGTRQRRQGKAAGCWCRMTRKVRFGTYAATLTAAEWGHCLLALELRAARLKREGYPGMAEDVRRAFDALREQVTEERDF
jgi:hypothetical protein